MRKELTITIDTGRDAGKVFRVTEMPVSRLEKWCARALLALFGAEGDIPPDIARLAETSAGAAVAAAASLLRGLRGLAWEKAEPLYDELLDFIARVPRPERPDAVVQLRQENLDAHIEDVATSFRLRLEVVALSLGFSADGGAWASLLAASAAPQASAATPTSPM